MKPIGEFEEIVLLTVGILHGNAYGVSIKEEIEDRLNREISVGALQTTLRRLEKKGFVTSKQGEANQARGGRPKLFFTITASGKKALDYAHESRNMLYNLLPKVVLDL